MDNKLFKKKYNCVRVVIIYSALVLLYQVVLRIVTGDIYVLKHPINIIITITTLILLIYIYIYNNKRELEPRIHIIMAFVLILSNGGVAILL